ncbi:membrane protein [Corynebacterium phocae]|uniref:Galactan 5-O-arabinofuranosyltransferase n=1 Tax=Corynebacterium phocae TaxID=161895 RepID=A0A1L7D624_9CORY|nr:membrane protein [Corynebacterium phocae]
MLRPSVRPVPYAADLISVRAALAGIFGAGVGAFVTTLLAWMILKQTSLPAFSTSMVTRALTTVGIVGIVIVAMVFLGWWLMDEYLESRNRPVRRPKWRTYATYLVAYLAPAALVVAAIGIPLSATRLWLDGIQIDQVFRTQFLTRTTEQGGYADMNYLGLPSYYPLGWFWLGGRLANLLGIPGWAIFQPWALISLATAGSILVPIWQRLIGSLPIATALALFTTAATLMFAAEEPYSAVIAMGVPAVAVLASHAFRGSWAATIGVLLYLGISATFYTLFTGVVAITIVSLLAVVTAVYGRVWLPIIRLVIIGCGSLAIAAIAWGPYLIAASNATAPLESAAQHYLPAEGTQIPVPFLAPSLVGIICFIGLVFLVLRWADLDVRALAWALGGVYGWIVASMVTTLAGTTLLGFRLEIIVVLILGTAGILGMAEARLMGVHLLYPARFDVPTNRAITWAFIVVLSFAGVHFAQGIPGENESAIDHAYSDTDGYGERADRFPADSSKFYPEINEFIHSHGLTPIGTVIMTDEKQFLAFHPYHGFNAYTAHYANPLGEFKTRNAQMETWAEQSWSSTPEEFLDALESAPWKGPDAIIFRGSLDVMDEKDISKGEGFKIHLAEDIYPNYPNVRYRAVFYSPKVFEKGWDLKQVGPYVVAVRK